MHRTRTHYPQTQRTTYTSRHARPAEPSQAYTSPAHTAEQPERLQTEQQQRLASLELMALGITHDFNNLLVSIIGNAELALLDLPPQTEARTHVETIHRAALRGTELVDQLLTYAGRRRRTTQLLTINTLIRETEGILEAAVSRSCTVKDYLADGLPLIEADATQIRQLVMNLVINAAEALGEAGGTIILETSAEELCAADLEHMYLGVERSAGLYVRLTVADNGPGMDEATLRHIFDPFFTTKPTGRGLGLAVVHGIVRNHHGAIQVASAPGQGTSFNIWLPVASLLPPPQ